MVKLTEYNSSFSHQCTKETKGRKCIYRLEHLSMASSNLYLTKTGIHEKVKKCCHVV